MEDSKLKSALGSIMDLASENLIDPRDVPEDRKAMKRVAKQQQEDMALVQKLWEIL